MEEVKKKKTVNNTSAKKKTTAKKKQNKKQKITKGDKILLGVFGALLVLVIVLSIMVIYKSKTVNKDEIADLTIPVYDVGNNENITLNVANLYKKGEYNLKIVNYKENKVNRDILNYSITFENKSKSKISVTKDSDKSNLMTSQNKTKIEGLSLKKDEKEEVFYHIKIVDAKNIKNSDKINIKIES